MSDDLGDLIRKFYTVDGVLGIRARWDDMTGSVAIRIRRETPELVAAIERVLKGRPYTLVPLRVSDGKGRELDEAFAASKATRAAGIERAMARSKFGSGWGSTGVKTGAHGDVLKARRAEGNGS